MKKLHPILFLLLLFTSSSLSAQLAVWDFTGDVLTASTVDASVTAADATHGGLASTTSFFTCNGDAWSPNSWDAAGADYAEYSITVNAEMSIAISEFSFVARISGSGPSTFEVRSSDDGYAAAILTGTNSGSCASKGGALPSTIYAVGGETVTFRIYGFGSTSSGGNMRMDDVTIVGTSLPVEFTKFSATRRSERVLLEWQTASEINNDRFEIERFDDAGRLETIGTVRGEGNSVRLIDYTFVDESPLMGTNYYRLKQIDIDGRFDYSDVVSVEMDRSSVSITPTSTFDFITVNTGAQSSIMVRSINGQVMNSQSDVEGNFTVEMANYPQGIYFLMIELNGTVQTKKVVRL